MNATTTKLLAVGAIIVVVAASVGGFIYFKNQNNNDTSVSGEWNEILEDAKGQKLNIAFYASDSETKEFLAYMKVMLKQEYGIELSWNSYGAPATATVKSEMESGITSNGTFDLIWGDTTMFGNVVSDSYNYMYTNDGNGWVSILPNSSHLKDDAEGMVTTGVAGYVPGSACEFSGGQTMYVYNPDYCAIQPMEGVDMPYNCVAVYENNALKGFIKVSGATSTSTYAANTVTIEKSSISDSKSLEDAIAAETTVYNIDQVRTAVKDAYSGSVSGHIKYGLPTNYTELASWIRIYKQQFTYPDATNAYANFHTNLILSAIIYELTYNDATAKTGWKPAPDRAANVEAVNQKLKTITTQAQFDEAFGYLYSYLNDIKPYCNTEIGYVGLPNTVSAINGKIVGCQESDKDYSDHTVLIGMTTCTSIDMRDAAYNCKTAVFSMDTTCTSQYYLLIPQNSSHKAAAMVLANYLLDPKVQASWFIETGNLYNIDVGEDNIWSDYFATPTASWSKYISAERSNEAAVVGLPLCTVSKLMDSGWKTNVKGA